ncbi:hypothetical protein L5515_012925 [Caenorhabditis briggsae]|uniref:C-type lectin domain-containing protein n=1 Tax=Caenorhabditis briggsae TaxID=6238 RepID=A0AAE9EYT8_CAEBR|nr:hypothetical protein L5515_012925 [Caenorhabditis briggsae]
MNQEIKNYEYIQCPKMQKTGVSKSLEFVLSAKSLSNWDQTHEDPGYAYIIHNHKPTDPRTQFSNILSFYWRKHWRFVLGGLGLFIVLFLILLIVLLVPKRKLVVQTETTTTRTVICAYGFQLIHNHKCWKLFTENRTFSDAERNCETLYGSSLVSIENKAENYQLGLLATIENLPIWIGLQCEGNQNGDCFWVKNNETLGVYSNFGTDNPNWFNGSCIFYDNKGELISKACDEKLPYVCETEATNF